MDMATLLGLAGGLVVLSMVVQAIQELWKHLTCTEARLFEAALAEFVGPSASRALRTQSPGPLTGARRFRLWGRDRSRLPADRDSLLFLLETAAPAWHVTVLRALEEQRRASGTTEAYPTACLDDVLYALERAASRPGAGRTPGEVVEFLARIGVRPGHTLNGARAVEEFRRRFFPHLTPLVERYNQLLREVEHATRRRSYRQLFVIASIVSLVVALPQLGRGAWKTPDGSVSPMAPVVAISAEACGGSPPRALADPCGGGYLQRTTVWQAPADADADDRLAPRVVRYAFVAALMSLVLTFSASLWNDIISALRSAAARRGAATS